MGWDGMGWDSIGWDGMGWHGMGWDRMGVKTVMLSIHSIYTRHLFVFFIV